MDTGGGMTGGARINRRSRPKQTPERFFQPEFYSHFLYLQKQKPNLGEPPRSKSYCKPAEGRR